MIWRALLILAVLVLLAGWALRGLLAYDRKLAGKGSATAPGSPDLCGSPGPYGMVCDRAPHDDWRHEQGTNGWGPA